MLGVGTCSAACFGTCSGTCGTCSGTCSAAPEPTEPALGPAPESLQRLPREGFGSSSMGLRLTAIHDNSFHQRFNLVVPSQNHVRSSQVSLANRFIVSLAYSVLWRAPPTIGWGRRIITTVVQSGSSVVLADYNNCCLESLQKLPQEGVESSQGV